MSAPPRLPTERQYERLLGWVNRERVRMGRKPRIALTRGTPRQPGACPIARSLGVDCVAGTGQWARFDVDHPNPVVASMRRRQFRPMPKYVAEFIHRFDRGWYRGMVR